MPTHIAVLPTEAQKSLASSSTLRPLQLPHPRTGLTALFLPHGSTILELHAIAPDAPRSWFVGQSVVSDGKLVLMTPIDPAFLLIPLLRKLLENEPQCPFKPTDDLVEEFMAQHSETKDLSRFLRMDCVQHALRQLCDTKDIAPDVTVQRPSNERILAFLKRRVERVVSAQETPTTDSTSPNFPTLHRQHLRLGLSLDELGPLTCPTAQPVRAAARIKIACEIIGAWVEAELMDEVLKTYDVSAYTAYAEARAAEARAELAAATARAEAAEVGKPKGKNTGEKRKAAGQGTRGAEKLKKVNTKGMSALTTFFGKKE
ncbi:hypothetical protein FS749_010357 [Ceratobasidium sp. UAMH 11750]|nr:hypothetical protein FS749_010357 [Ceratobasidium sp. UAMH 11750]